MSIYLDTSVVVAFLLPDVFSVRADKYLLSRPFGIVISDFISAEFASAVGKRLRMKITPEPDARRALVNFDT